MTLLNNLFLITTLLLLDSPNDEDNDGSLIINGRQVTSVIHHKNREAIKIKKGINGKTYLKNLTSNDSRKIKVGITQANNMRSNLLWLRLVNANPMVNNTLTQHNTPRGIPNPQTVD